MVLGLLVLVAPLAAAEQPYGLTSYHTVLAGGGGFTGNGGWNGPSGQLVDSSSFTTNGTTGYEEFGVEVLSATGTADYYAVIQGEHWFTTSTWGGPTGFLPWSAFGYYTSHASQYSVNLYCHSGETLSAWVHVYTAFQVTDVTAGNSSSPVYGTIASSQTLTCSGGSQSWAWPSSTVTNAGFYEINNSTNKVWMTNGDQIKVKFQMGCEAYVDVTTWDGVVNDGAQANCNDLFYQSADTFSPTVVNI